MKTLLRASCKDSASCPRPIDEPTPLRVGKEMGSQHPSKKVRFFRMPEFCNWLLSHFVILATCLQASNFTPFDTDSDVQNMISFLTSPSQSVGASYQPTAGGLQGLLLPLSYYSTADFWGQYVANLPGNDCTVTDVYSSNDYTLTPSKSSPGADLQVERVNVFNGIDIYDGAAWQIALALAANAGIQGPSGASLFSIAQNEDQLLLLGYDGNASSPTAGANRAISQANGTFTYNGISITNAPNAYFFRMVPPNWLATDPFMGTSYAHYITAVNLPPNPDYQAGKITWLDWKPITGENSWAFLIGPLQNAQLQYVVHQKGSFVPHSSTAVQNALNVLYALRCMQSQLGGIYYATKGSLGNTGDAPVNPYEVSVENNASTLCGLLMFQQILEQELANEPNLSSADRATLQGAVANIQTMIYGGATPQGTQTQGLLAFFKTSAWDAENFIFYQGGIANDPNAEVDWQPTREPKAVDVSTWSVTVLGQPTLDGWFGFGSAYNIWESLKQWGGFFGPNQALWGVGYSDEDGNGSGGDYKKGILSAEWTAGAINMVRALIVQYEAAASSSNYSPSEQSFAAQYVQALLADEKSMANHLGSLRSDTYATTPAFASVCPPDYNNLIPFPQDKLSYLYASKRYMIPFGWFANPLPSTTSTAWAIMLHYEFNPLTLGGSYQSHNW